jgi:hypothetical protein
MAITQINVSSPSNEVIFTDTSMVATADGIKSSSALVYSISIDNSQNAGAASYVKLFNLASGSVTVGTTVPDEVIYAPQGSITVLSFKTSANPGKTFGTALAACCVTTGGTAGNTPPSSSVVVSISYT